MAEYHPVQKVLCDGEEILNTIGEDLFFNFERGVLGLRSEVDDCHLVNFYSIVTMAQSHDDITGEKQRDLSILLGVGKRTSCSDEVTPADSSPFTSFQLTSEYDVESDQFYPVSLKTDQFEGCEELIMKIN